MGVEKQARETSIIYERRSRLGVGKEKFDTEYEDLPETHIYFLQKSQAQGD
jgi:hypothetical protein